MTATISRNEICDVIRTAWLANGTSAPILMLWDNVKGDKPGLDADALPDSFARTTVRHFTGTQETLGGPGARRFQTEGQVVVQIFTPYGDGHDLADQLVEVIKVALRNKVVASNGLWFFDINHNELGQDGAWFQTNVNARFRYEEIT